MKDRAKFEHRHNSMYFIHWPSVTCIETYGEEMDRH